MSASFSTRLKAIREDARLSQNTLAGILGLAVSTLSRMESGEMGNPTIDTIDRIASFFGVTREWLFDGKRPMFIDESPEAAWLRYSQLLVQKVGTEKERELREQKLMIEISTRVAQTIHCDPEQWEIYRQQIISAIDAHAVYCLEHSAELKLARLKAARATAGKKIKS